MRKYPLFILLLFVLIFTVGWIGEVLPADPTPGAAGVGDPYFPTLGNGGYDAQHYTIDLVADLETNTISSTVTMEALATQSLSSFNLDFVGFIISDLRVNDEPASFTRDQRELTITPARPLLSGEFFEVTISYSGVPGRATDLTELPFAGGWTAYSGGVYVASEPDGASQWYPVNDHPSDKATYTLIITVPKPYVVAANGVLQETIDAGTHTTYVWHSDDRMASYLVTVNIALFTRHDDTHVHDIPIRNYFPTTSFDRGVRTFDRTAGMMATFTDLFGAYPFDVYGAVVADTSLPFALETQTLSLFGTNIYGGDRSQMTIAHELAHAWFGDDISPLTWRDIWLNEGFATYASLLWIEEHGTQEEFDTIINVWQRTVRRSSVIIGDPGVHNLFSITVYYKGALTLHALRLRVGDETFFDIVRTYKQRYAGGNASIADFILVAEDVSGQQLDDFFQAWLYEPGLPEFE